MMSIDNRLAEIYEILKNADQFQESSEFYKNAEDAKKIGEAIGYLRATSKLQLAVNTVVNDDSAKYDLVKRILEIEQQIARYEDELKKVPRKKSIRITGRNRDGFLGRFEALDNNAKIRAIEEENAKNEAEKNRLKAEIKSCKGKIKELNSFAKKLVRGQDITEICFPEDKEFLSRRYQDLIQSCALAMNHGSIGKDIVGKADSNAIFTYDENQGAYQVNVKQARGFLRKIRDRKAVLSAAEHVDNKIELERVQKEYARVSDNQTRYEAIAQMEKNSDFQRVIDDMNSIIINARALHSMEYEASQGTFFTHVKNRLREMVQLEPVVKIPRRVIKARHELSEEITSFTESLKHNKALRDAFDSYAFIRNHAEGSHLSVEGLANESKTVERFGIFKVMRIPAKHIDMQGINGEAMELYRDAKDESTFLQKRKEEVEARFASSQAKLSKKAQKLIEEDGDERVLEYANQYYDRPSKNLIQRTNRQDCSMTQSAAAVILEGIIGKRKLIWNKMNDAYQKVLGEDAIITDNVDVTMIASQKIDELKGHILSIANRPADIPPVKVSAAPATAGGTDYFWRRRQLKKEELPKMEKLPVVRPDVIPEFLDR